MDDYREVILTNAEESLAPFVPFVVESFSGFTGEKHLVIRMENLRSVAGIENMPPLDELRIHRTQVVDVDPLTRGERPAPAVMALQRLKLTDSRIVDISGLRTLLALERVDLSGNPDLRDVSALGRMKRLYSLSLMGTDLPDLAALAGLTGLTSLSVSWQRRSAAPLSLRPLASLRHLGSLLIGGREGADLAALRTLVVLEDLDIDIGDDLGAIPDLPRLRELNIDSEKLTSVAPLRRARRLEILSLGVEQPVRLTPLADIPTLRRLYVASGSWADFLEAERAALNNIRPDLIYKD
jgi:Leucine-rich repeat (LRR) protein